MLKNPPNSSFFILDPILIYKQYFSLNQLHIDSVIQSQFFSFACQNVFGLVNDIKFLNLVSVLEDFNLDFFAISETHFHNYKIKSVNHNFKGSPSYVTYWSAHPTKPKSAGVGLFIKSLYAPFIQKSYQ